MSYEINCPAKKYSSLFKPSGPKSIFRGLKDDVKSKADVTNAIKHVLRTTVIPDDEKLHVITMMSNPIGYKKRTHLAKEFIKRMNEEPNVILYIVEIAYDCRPVFEITDPNNHNHLQLRTGRPLWHKENAWKVGAKRLLPFNWNAVAFVDMDILFESHTWAVDTMKLLASCDPVILQMHSSMSDMDEQEKAMTIFQSSGFLWNHYHPHTPGGSVTFPHPGLSVAMNRKAFEQLGLFEFGVLGSGDNIMTMSLRGEATKFAIISTSHEDYRQSIIDYQKKAEGIKFGYTPGMVRHYFHGSKVNRKYVERNVILVKYRYSPKRHLVEDANGLLQPSPMCPDAFLEEIMEYFKQRNEDE